MAWDIDLTLDYAKPVTGLAKIVKQFDAVNASMLRAQKTAAAFQTPAVQASANTAPAAQAANTAAAKIQQAKFLGGPYQRLAATHVNLQRAIQQGTQNQINDAQIALQKAQASLARQTRQPASFGMRLLQLIGTTRIGMGHGGMQVMPLVNRIGSLFTGAGAGAGGAGLGGAGGLIGGSAAGGPIGIAIGVGVAALAAFTEAVKAAAERADEFAKAGQTTGGTVGNIAFLKTLGVDPGLGAHLRQVRTEDPFAMQASRQLGLGVALPRPFGSANEAEGLEKAIKAIAFYSDDAAVRLTKARMLDMESLVPQIEMYRRHAAEIDQDSAASKAALGANAEKSVDFQNALRHLGAGWDRVIDALSGPWMQILTPIFEGIGDGLSRLAENMTLFYKAEEPLRDAMVFIIDTMNDAANVAWEFSKRMGFLSSITDAVQKAIGWVSDKLQEFYGWIKALAIVLAGAVGGEQAAKATSDMFGRLEKWVESGLKASAQATAQNTGATKANTDAMAKLHAGITGGGQRAKGAIPDHLRGYTFQRGMDMQALSLGAFAL